MNYIVLCDENKLDSVYEALKMYEPHKFTLISGLALKVSDEKEASLLEALVNISDITYRKASEYKAND